MYKKQSYYSRDFRNNVENSKSAVWISNKLYCEKHTVYYVRFKDCLWIANGLKWNSHCDYGNKTRNEPLYKITKYLKSKYQLHWEMSLSTRYQPPRSHTPATNTQICPYRKKLLLLYIKLIFTNKEIYRNDKLGHIAFRNHLTNMDEYRRCLPTCLHIPVVSCTTMNIVLISLN